MLSRGVDSCDRNQGGAEVAHLGEQVVQLGLVDDRASQCGGAVGLLAEGESELDPPLNLGKVSKTPLRLRLLALRREYARERRVGVSGRLGNDLPLGLKMATQVDNGAVVGRRQLPNRRVQPKRLREPLGVVDQKA